MKHSLSGHILASSALTLTLLVTGAVTSAPASTFAHTPTVALARSAEDSILVDGQHQTLYLFEKDSRGRSACGGVCSTYWPPLLTKGKPAAGRGLKGTLLGVTRRADGTTQVTYAGHPLYRFLQDSRPGQTNGQDSDAFGGGWYVLSRAGTKVERGGR